MVKKINDREEEDRISRLPDNLIHHILSLSNIDAKHAVQTCVFSKKWKNIWKSLPFLNFNRRSFPVHQDSTSFIEFVYMVFLHRDGDTNIQKFTVDWQNPGYVDRVIMNVNIWIAHALKHNVEEIQVVMRQLSDLRCRMPHHLLNCKSLRKLVIKVFNGTGAGYLDIILPRSMNLPQLKELALRGISISDVESSARLFSSCPVLEKLEINNYDIHYRRDLIVGSVSLKKFEYGFQYRLFFPLNGTMATTVMLCTPNLESFSCSYLEYAEAYSSAEKQAVAKRMRKLVGELYMVKTMILSAGFLESNSSAHVGDDWEAGLSLPGRLSHLKAVQIEKLEGCDVELKVLSFLLRNAKVLERVSLYFRDIIDSPDTRRFKKKLKAVPRASSSVNLEFKSEISW